MKTKRSIPMNFIMIIASLTIALSGYIFAGSYSDELKGAYDYAFSIKITTQPTIDQSDMYGNLIRSHMAKMMVNYAKNVLGKTPNTLVPCVFADIDNQTDEFKGYIKEACQLGLMGVGMVAFEPDTLVTRAQFGTVLSRALYGTGNDNATPYYTKHLQALKTATIMNNISDPTINEVRGYVMLMMQRAAKTLGLDGYGYGQTPATTTTGTTTTNSGASNGYGYGAN